jgi:signal peptidase I
MEIAPVPHRSATRGERRRLLLGVLVLAPVVLLVLLPAVLGLDRSVVSDDAMSGSMSRGAVVLARDVPPDDLVTGDVISFTAPSGPEVGDVVTRRVVALDGTTATTRGDTRDAVDPWRLQLDAKTYARVWTGIPLLGYPFLLDGGWVVLVALALVALTGAVVATRRHRRAEQALRAVTARPSRPRLPVA